MRPVLLALKNITITVAETAGEKVLVDDVHLEIPENKIVALVGGSGSGKTTTGLAILRLLPLALKLQKGEIWFNGKNLLDFAHAQMRQLRGKDISMVFQEPLNAFNPVFTLGYQIEEVLKFHTALNRKQRRERIWELLKLVGLPEPQRVAGNYPHQLSGGMRQRAMIAQAIAAGPQLIIADEPTSSLDVTLQARIIELFRALKEKLQLSILLITHDLGLVSHLADEVAVMTEGKIVERGLTQEVVRNPQHAYTRQLMEAMRA